MKKQVVYVILSMIFLFASFSPARAEFTYKVYNPKENKSYTVTLGTIGVTPTKYIFGFFHNHAPYCVIVAKDDIQNNLVGGQCIEFNAFFKYIMNENNNIDLNKYRYGWREYSKDTFYQEVDAIMKNRQEKGLTVF